MRSKQLPTLKTSRSQPELRRDSLSPQSDKNSLSPRHDPFLSLSRNGSAKLLPVCPSSLRIPGSTQRSPRNSPDVFTFTSKHLLPPLNPRREPQTCPTRKVELPFSRPTKNMKRLNTPCFGSSGSESAESGSTMLTIDELSSPTFENLAVSDDPEVIYQLAEKISEGSCGPVYKALHKSTRARVAIKILQLNSDDLVSAHKDMAVLQQFRNFNIVECLGSYIKNNDLWIVMEYFDADTVRDLLKLMKNPFDEIKIAAICRQILRAIDYLHDNRVVHGNLEGKNVLIDRKGTVKLRDAMLSAILQKWFPKQAAISPYWMPPETIIKQSFYKSSDIWSLGVTAIEMAEGSAPYSALPSERAVASIRRRPAQSLTEPHRWSDVFNDFISKCLVIEPNQRATAKELLIHPFIAGAKGPELLRELSANFQGKDKKRKDFLSFKEEDCNECDEEENMESVFTKLVKHTKLIKEFKLHSQRSPKTSRFLKSQLPFQGSVLSSQRNNNKFDSSKMSENELLKIADR
ncbi:unnamed protein product [Blepharisma stoltei]|uniref:Protein kinase domain-containing protein n=1 Tax=Blepharisma stoltei TaxID=1481888 RepID=A0AAU9IA29_9CILI|nr:unnamed protein product [Blepharisma stoltei]